MAHGMQVANEAKIVKFHGPHERNASFPKGSGFQ